MNCILIHYLTACNLNKDGTVHVVHPVVVYDPRVCHDLDPKSYLNTHSQNLCHGHIF